MGYAIRVTTKAVQVVAGSDESASLVAAEASGAKIGKGLRSKWGGGEIRSRSKIVRQGSGWSMEGSGYTSPAPGYSSFSNTPAGSPFLGTPAGFSNPSSPNLGHSFSSPPVFGPHSPNPRNIPPPPSRGMRTSSLGVDSHAASASPFEAAPLPGTPSYGVFPPTPNPAFGGGFPTGPPPGAGSVPPSPNPGSYAASPRIPKKDD